MVARPGLVSVSYHNYGLYNRRATAGSGGWWW